jgi:hypothetical protein
VAVFLYPFRKQGKIKQSHPNWSHSLGGKAACRMMRSSGGGRFFGLNSCHYIGITGIVKRPFLVFGFAVFPVGSAMVDAQKPAIHRLWLVISLLRSQSVD